MPSPNSGLDPLYQDPWIRAELTYVKNIINFLFDEESRLAPGAAPALESMKASSGKMLRPLLVILGARAAAGSPSSYDYGKAIAAPVFAASLSLAVRKQIQKLKRSGWGVADSGELDAWLQATPEAGALPNRIYLLAAALELLHMATLVHDDVVDESPLRRGQAAVWKLLGESHAVLLGDLLLSLCFALVSHGSETSTGRLISNMVRVMVRSEFFQAEDRDAFEELMKKPSRRRYFRVITGKTAMLFSLALTAGAREMGADEASVQALRRGGYHLGLAFQIQDDLLDFLGSKARYGKPLGQDLRDGQLTLPLIEALGSRGQRASLQDSKSKDANLQGHDTQSRKPYQGISQEERRTRLMDLVLEFRKGGEDCFQEILDLTRELGGFEAAENSSLKHLARSRQELNQVTDRHSAQGVAERLSKLLDFLADRRY